MQTTEIALGDMQHLRVESRGNTRPGKVPPVHSRGDERTSSDWKPEHRAVHLGDLGFLKLESGLWRLLRSTQQVGLDHADVCPYHGNGFCCRFRLAEVLRAVRSFPLRTLRRLGQPLLGTDRVLLFTKSFFGGFTLPHFGSGSCLSIAAGGFYVFPIPAKSMMFPFVRLEMGRRGGCFQRYG
jgi:hypothetical protein